MKFHIPDFTSIKKITINTRWEITYFYQSDEILFAESDGKLQYTNFLTGWTKILLTKKLKGGKSNTTQGYLFLEFIIPLLSHSNKIKEFPYTDGYVNFTIQNHKSLFSRQKKSELF